jgi:hypothetical protein
MTLDKMIARQRAVQKIVVARSRGEITDTTARDDLRKAGLSSTEITRLLDAIAANIITPRSA